MDETDKIECFAREARKRLVGVDFFGQDRVHSELEQKYGVTLKQVIDRACKLADLDKVKEAEELANSVVILREPANWLSFDRSLIPTPTLIEAEVFDFTKNDQQLRLPQLRLVSPSVNLLMRLRDNKISLADLHWRDFERTVPELLEQDGWTVKLRRGSKDKGVDIEAERMVQGAGPILTVWQAKHLHRRKVGIRVVRELEDTMREFGTSKGVVVTSSFLTHVALKRIERDTYTLAREGGPQ